MNQYEQFCVRTRRDTRVARSSGRTDIIYYLVLW